MARNSENLMDEADVGSGEKNAADRETQRQIEKIPQQDLHNSAPPEKPKDEKQQNGKA